MDRVEIQTTEAVVTHTKSPPLVVEKVVVELLLEKEEEAP